MPQIDPNFHIRSLERLAELSRSIGNSQDLESLLLSMTEVACDLTASEMASVMLYEHETDLLKFVVGPINQRERLKRMRVPVEKSLAGHVYKTSKPIILDHAENDPRIFREVEKELGFTTKSVAAVPLLFHGETVGVFEALNKRDGQAYTAEDLTVLETLASQAAVAILSNILFDEVRRAFQEVDELERMKSNFIAITSHELRTPLGLVLGHATFLNELIDDPELKQQLDVIIRSANRLKSIIENLSNVNDYQTGISRLRHRTLSINQVVAGVVNSQMKNAQEKHIAISTRVPEIELVVDADEEKISLALNNLVSNAISFTDSGGQILVMAERLPGYVQVSVIDNGIGIPAKDLPRVFDRFFQVQSHLTRRHGGMGLGLSVSKAMVELHKGQIWVESAEGKGSKFTFILPLQKSNETQLPKVSAFIT